MAESAVAHGVHRSWVDKLLARYRAHGEPGPEPGSRRPLHSLSRVSDLYQDEMVVRGKEPTGVGSMMSRSNSNRPSASSACSATAVRVSCSRCRSSMVTISHVA